MALETRGAGRLGRLGHDANLEAVARALGAVPQTVAELAAASDLHPRTVRRVLDALPELGVDVRRGEAKAGEGRGRPAHTFCVTKRVGKLATRFEATQRREPTAPAHGHEEHTRHALRKARRQQQTALACARKLAAVVELLDVGELVKQRRRLETDLRWRRAKGSGESVGTTSATVGDLAAMPRTIAALRAALEVLDADIARAELGPPPTRMQERAPTRDRPDGRALAQLIESSMEATAQIRYRAFDVESAVRRPNHAHKLALSELTGWWHELNDALLSARSLAARLAVMPLDPPRLPPPRPPPTR